MHRFALASLMCLTLLVGCTVENTNFTIETRDGVPHAINRGTNVWSDSAAAPLEFTREQTFGTNEGAGPPILGGIGGIGVDSTSTVYVLDDENHRLVAFRPDETVQWSAGRAGQGPGEFHDARSLTVRNDTVYVDNNAGRQIDIWTTAGDFMKRYTFGRGDLRSPDLVGFARGHLVISETGYGANPQQIHALDPMSWEVSHTFELPSQLKLPQGLASSASVKTIGGDIYVSSPANYEISRYTVDGQLKRRTIRTVDSLLRPGTHAAENSRSIRSYSDLGAPVILSDGHLLVHAWWATNVHDPDAHLRRFRNDSAVEMKPATILDLFSPKGRYRGSLRWNDRFYPSIGEPQFVGTNGKLYTTTSDPFPQIRRYAVTIKDQ